MSVRIRLSRGGKKGAPVYKIVVADARAPRDGRFIDKLGIYNPMTNPALVRVDNRKALYWLEVGAQPTNTAKAILRYSGALYRKHLKGGVNKGVFNQLEAEGKFNSWLETIREKNYVRYKIIKSSEEYKSNNSPESRFSIQNIFKTIKSHKEHTYRNLIKNKINGGNMEGIILEPFETLSEVFFINNTNDENLNSGENYKFRFTVEVKDRLNQKELLETFTLAISSSSSKIISKEFIKLSFDGQTAVEIIEITPVERGESILRIDLFQNFNMVDTINVPLTIL